LISGLFAAIMVTWRNAFDVHSRQGKRADRPFRGERSHHNDRHSHRGLPGFVASEPEHCHDCHRLIRAGWRCTSRYPRSTPGASCHSGERTKPSLGSERLGSFLNASCTTSLLALGGHSFANRGACWAQSRSGYAFAARAAPHEHDARPQGHREPATWPPGSYNGWTLTNE
jgi:hypothetical protein